MTGREPFVRGREADLFDLGDGTVERRYRDESHRTEREALVMTLARDAGYPVPRVRDAMGPSIVMDKVDGPTMMQQFAAGLAHTRELLGQLAELHARLHSIPAGADIPARCGGGEYLVHLDLHPGNVLMSVGGPVVIDWSGAGRGPAGVDLGLTWLLLAYTESYNGMSDEHLQAVGGVAAEVFARSVDEDALFGSLPTAIGYRLGLDTVLDRERAKLERLTTSAGARELREMQRRRRARTVRTESLGR